MDHDILKRHTTAQITTQTHTSTPPTAPVVYTAHPQKFTNFEHVRLHTYGRMDTTENNGKIFLDKTNGLRAEQCRIYTG